MGYFRDLHTNPDGSCITCNTQQLAYQDYKGCLCSIIDDVGADKMSRIIKLLEGYQGLTGMFALERDDLIALIKGENK